MFADEGVQWAGRGRHRRGQEVLRRTLGLRVSEEHGLLTLHIAGGRDIVVYPKPDHSW